ncbi:type II secretion system minor pseudopilin GspK [Tepidimonas alkaliphilus]|nr:type II secretion system minor pseudopilin GspK [Tepidimonas alkaliphilus]
MRRTRGAALLMALMLMAVVATLGAAAWSLQWRAWAVERAARDQAQAAWLLTGALDWARLIVREDGRASRTDHLAEPWAVPLQPTRLSTFLRASADDGADVLDDAWLAGRIEDAQARLNWRNLIDVTGATPRLNPMALAAFERLYAQLDLPPEELRAVAEALQQAWPAGPQRPARHPLPERAADLQALGLSAASWARLAPHTIWLPQPTPVNLNTAGPVVLRAAIAGLDGAEAQRLLALRNQRPFERTEALVEALPRLAASWQPALLSVSSQHFLVTGQLRLGELTVQQTALLRRNGARVEVLWRQQGVAGPASLP